MEAIKMGMIQDIESLQKKAGSYNVLKEEYDRMVSEVNKAVSSLRAIVDGSSEPNMASTGKYGMQKAIADKLYFRMKSEDNFFVTNDVIRQQPELDGSTNQVSAVGNVLARLAKMPGVKKTKDGTKVRLFYVKLSIETDASKFGSLK